jgi:transcriptional regulator with PAS, ATPase and Fis domain
MDKLASLNLIGRSPLFLAALCSIEKFAFCDATVLIQGETGAGKELAARAIHCASSRRDCPFVPVNCGALQDNLADSKLFGQVRGAFTDAKETKVGLVAHAKGGTLFLDEVEAVSPRTQVTLLRFLQDKEYRPVGAVASAHADVRVIAASNDDLRSLANRGLYRWDLYYRLNVLSLRMPALRDRPGDVRLLSQFLVDQLNSRSGQPKKILDPDSIALLEAYSWPGNVRELENLIHREFLLASDDVVRISNPDPDAIGSASEVRTIPKERHARRGWGEAQPSPLALSHASATLASCGVSQVGQEVVDPLGDRPSGVAATRHRRCVGS